MEAQLTVFGFTVIIDYLPKLLYVEVFLCFDAPCTCFLAPIFHHLLWQWMTSSKVVFFIRCKQVYWIEKVQTRREQATYLPRVVDSLLVVICAFFHYMCMLQFVLRGCVPVGVYVAAAATVPTDPPAQRAAARALTTPCALWEWDSSPWVSSWSCGRWYRWMERTLRRATPPTLGRMMRRMTTAETPQSLRRWRWYLWESGQPCCFYQFASAWGTRGTHATEVTSQHRRAACSWDMWWGRRKNRELPLFMCFIIFRSCCQLEYIKPVSVN